MGFRAGLLLAAIGCVLFLHGWFRARLAVIGGSKQVEVRFIPRDQYENLVFSKVVTDPYLTDDMWLARNAGPTLTPWAADERSSGDTADSSSTRTAAAADKI